MTPFASWADLVTNLVIVSSVTTAIALVVAVAGLSWFAPHRIGRVRSQLPRRGR
jgi:hypothetical protein